MTEQQIFFTEPSEVVAAHRIIEEERAEHYTELADAFDLHGNPDAAEAFRRLAHEARETAETLTDGQAAAPSGFQWPDMDEVISEQDALHYMMRPYHVLETAIATRQRMLEQFQAMTEGSRSEAKSRAVRATEQMEQYLEDLTQRLEATPLPEPDWDEDLDPPNYDSE